MFRIDILTLFPEMFNEVFSSSIIGRATQKQLVQIRAIDIREFATDKHRVADDYPYGGGGGMVMKPEPIARAVESVLGDEKYGRDEATTFVFLTPQGTPYTQTVAEDFSKKEHLILLCGHYEGIDERIREMFSPVEISVGDYVLTGGEIPAMVVVDSAVRLIGGVLGNEDSAVNDSFTTGILDFPHYTRPEVFREHKTPEVLLSGHHENIRQWRREKALERTLKVRPDLLLSAKLNEEDVRIIKEYRDNAPANAEGEETGE